MSKDYSPLKALRRVTRSMDAATRKMTPAHEQPLTLSTSSQPLACAVLLRSLTEGGPVPDDFTGLPKTATAFRTHIRPDGAVYKGAFELQGDRTSVVLVYGPTEMLATRAEQIATSERPALLRRQASFELGPFAVHPIRPTPTSSASS